MPHFVAGEEKMNGDGIILPRAINTIQLGGDLDKALHQLEKNLPQCSTSAQPYFHYHISRLHFKLGSLKNGIRAARKAAELAPHDVHPSRGRVDESGVLARRPIVDEHEFDLEPVFDDRERIRAPVPTTQNGRTQKEAQGEMFGEGRWSPRGRDRDRSCSS